MKNFEGLSLSIAAFFAVVSPWAVAAQETLQLSDLYRAAARTPRIEASAAEAAAARARISATKVPPDPMLQLGFMNRSLPSLRPMDPLGMTQIQITQMIPSPGKLRLGNRIAVAEANAASERSQAVKWEVRTSVANAFYELYRIDRSLAIAKETKRIVSDISKTASAMYAVGEGKQADVLRAQVEVARMDEDIARMSTMRDAALSTLASLLDQPESALRKSPAIPVLPDSIPSLDSLVAGVERDNPLVRAGKQEVERSAINAALSRKELIPDVEIGVQYGQNRGPEGVERMGSLMIGASLPVFARSRQLRMREESQAMQLAAESELRSAKAELRGMLAEAVADFRRAANLASLYRSTIIPQAEATVTASFAAYRSGDINLMTLLESQSTANGYRQQVVALDADKGKALARIEMLIGRELFNPDAQAARGTDNVR